MNQKTFKQIKKLCLPLIKLSPYVKAVWIYGSSITKKRYNDIDIFVLVDDTSNLTKKRLLSIIDTCIKISDKSPETLLLHFQKPMPLTQWWSLIVKGEPWILTSIKKPLIIHDPSNYVSLMNKMLKRREIYGKDIKAERLEERSSEYLFKNRELMLSTVAELFMAATEAAQIFLITKNKVLFSHKKILKELNKYLNTNTYREIMDLSNKVDKGTLSEFTGENLDYYTKKVKGFIENIEGLTVKELKSIDRQEWRK